MNKVNIAWDMETSDPDDVFTLCLLATHPKVNLVCVTVTPGSKHQIGVVKHILSKLSVNIPVGSKNKDHAKECVFEFHYKWLGKIDPAEPDGLGFEIINDAILKFPDLTIVCGASLGNIANVLDSLTNINNIVVQGGFAGDNIMPPELILEKFKGKITCPTFNLNGDVPAALKVVSTELIKNKTFVSKNVCHGVVYNNEMHDFIRKFKDRNLGLNLLFQGMDFYLSRNSNGKAFHDPLAACVAINNDVCSFENVDLYRSKGEWGANLSHLSNIKISIKVDMDKFKNTLIGD